MFRKQRRALGPGTELPKLTTEISVNKLQINQQVSRQVVTILHLPTTGIKNISLSTFGKVKSLKLACRNQVSLPSLSRMFMGYVLLLITIAIFSLASATECTLSEELACSFGCFVRLCSYYWCEDGECTCFCQKK
ncbi:unnamed protein product [Cylicocyclus nassatus]|uniref:Uncharacterized protein n=1 Tax=Cylicocyclus nassatus TaxID=53992 RepID=A0AA36GFC6_CYLNA|nr:unnamed protein product [Cylicocyclus nassatus]